MNKKMIGPVVGALLASCASVVRAQQGLDPKQQASDPKQQAAAARTVVVPHWYGGLAVGQTILDLPDDALPVAGTSTLNRATTSTATNSSRATSCTGTSRSRPRTPTMAYSPRRAS